MEIDELIYEPLLLLLAIHTHTLRQQKLLHFLYRLLLQMSGQILKIATLFSQKNEYTFSKAFLPNPLPRPLPDPNELKELHFRYRNLRLKMPMPQALTKHSLLLLIFAR